MGLFGWLLGDVTYKYDNRYRHIGLCRIEKRTNGITKRIEKRINPKYL